MLGIVSNIEGTKGKEGKKNTNSTGMEEASAEMKTNNDYTPCVLLSTRLLAQHFSLFGHESVEGCLGFFQLHSCKLILHFVVIMSVVYVIYASRYCL